MFVPFLESGCQLLVISLQLRGSYQQSRSLQVYLKLRSVLKLLTTLQTLAHFTDFKTFQQLITDNRKLYCQFLKDLYKFFLRRVRVLNDDACAADNVHEP